MVQTVKNITPEIHQFMAKNNSVLLSMADELTLQPDGSFKPKEASKNNMNIWCRRFWIDYHNANEEHIWRYVTNEQRDKRPEERQPFGAESMY